MLLLYIYIFYTSNSSMVLDKRWLSMRRRWLRRTEKEEHKYETHLQLNFNFNLFSIRTIRLRTKTDCPFVLQWPMWCSTVINWLIAHLRPHDGMARPSNQLKYPLKHRYTLHLAEAVSFRVQHSFCSWAR